MILVDANLVSETSRLRPEPSVLVWIEANMEQLYLPAPALSELRYGCSKLPPSAKRQELETWLADLLIAFGNRIVPFDKNAAEAHGVLRARLKAAGKPCPPSDSYIAAIALSLACPLATRNVRDFASTGVELINPWEP